VTGRGHSRGGTGVLLVCVVARTGFDAGNMTFAEVKRWAQLTDTVDGSGPAEKSPNQVHEVRGVMEQGDR
jgi:hypothetical protein